jgi:NRAMP (natural resistance-associated macrophage protein)-like metal ion transporter
MNFRAGVVYRRPMPTSLSGAGRKKRAGFARRFLSALGPGLITGAADDDPSGVATYSIAGAQLGTSLLWTAVFTWPLMAFVQMMCARIGMVTGRGLAGSLRRKVPRPVLVVLSIALLLANTLNIGADLSGMADAAEMLTRVNSRVFVVVFGVGITLATILLRYHQIASTLKWLALTLVAYPVVAFLCHPAWGSVLRDGLLPSLPKGSEAWATLVAILGTTISPYLFFWQASQEVEEEKAMGRRMLTSRLGATSREIGDRRLDVGFGTFASNVVMFFIILSTALTLHTHGITKISTSRQAAEALAPLAGKAAALLFTVGIFGVGCLAIPTLAGSAAYAFAETFHWRQGIDQKPARARGFYAIVIGSAAAGIAMDFAGVNPFSALFLSAVINGLLAPVLLAGILLVASDKALMRGQPSSTASRAVVFATLLLMVGAAVGMFVF